MRISQLSRKLNVSQTEITGLLKRRGIHDIGGGNSKLEKDHVHLVIEYFKPEMMVELGVSAIKKDEIPVSKLQETQSETADTKLRETDTITKKTAIIKNIPDIDDQEEIEVIRAPKIQLEGLKVVGKIDLPEKTKKAFVDKLPVEEAKKELPPTKVKAKKKDGQVTGKRVERKIKFRKRRNPEKQREETYDEKLKRREREKIRMQQEIDRKKRKKKREHYLKTVQAKKTVAAKPKTTKKQNPHINPSETRTKEKKVHKNAVRRLWAWLNGEYDDF